MNITNITVDPQSERGCDPVKEKVVKLGIQKGVLNEDIGIALFYNLTRYRKGVETLKSHFPSDWLHTMAIKSNGLLPAMKFARDLGLGFESASFGELSQAINTGVDPQKIVFDSPAKKLFEIKFALEKEIYLNIDNFQELDRVTAEVDSGKYKNVKVGIRVNPQVGLGTIQEMSTSGDYSKFGAGLHTYKKEIFEAYKERPWLNGIHVHVGSQGIPVSMAIQGIRRVVDAVKEINEQRGSQQIQFIDIGGGFSVNFDDENDDGGLVSSWEKYSQELRTNVPELFSGQYKVITEFGRRINAKPGFLATRVEYNKNASGRNIAITHAGADICLRTVYMPTKWAIRVSVTDSKGNLKQGERFAQDVAGPCCFASDIIAHERELPFIESGDWIIAHDTGAYYYSAFSYYNLRQAPPVYAFEENDNIKLIEWKKAQTVEETLAFFQ